jgi:hypothetical protein
LVDLALILAAINSPSLQMLSNGDRHGYLGYIEVYPFALCHPESCVCNEDTILIHSEAFHMGTANQ